MGKNNSATSAQKKVSAAQINAARPRSLADALRNLSDIELSQLLTLRPDLLHPVPADMTGLATRATTSPSVSAALDQLNHIQLAVCEAMAGLGDPTTIDDLHAGLAKVPGYDKKEITNALNHLRKIALVWGSDDDLHLVRVARESFGAYPCGLANAYSDSRRQVREYAAKKTLAKKVLSEGPEQAQEIMQQLLWTNPTGTMKNASRTVDVSKAKSPLEWLLAKELLIPLNDNTVAVPREVALALRDGQLLREVKADAQLPILSQVDLKRVDESGAHNALDFVRLVETLLETWSLEPPAQLRGGGLAIRDFAAACELLKVSEHLTALVIEVAHVAGLVNADLDAGWLPTVAYDRWLSVDDATRWTLLAQAWKDMARAPHVVGGEGSDRINPLTNSVERGFIAPLRTALLGIYLEMPAGSVSSADLMLGYLDWHRPRRASLVRAKAVAKLLIEAEVIGITSMGALTGFGNALANGTDPNKALASCLPQPVDHIIVQADLTALAPGRLPAVARRAMAVLADVESTGVATTYRFTENSIRRALDQGQSAHDILEFLNNLSRTALPQPLTYLIEDAARRHGVLRVGVASIYLRCDDPQLVATVQADRRLASLKFRELAPGIVVSSSPADIVLERLRDAGYAPVAESAEGTVLIHRPDTKRTSARVETAPVTISNPSDRLISAAVKALRAGERADKAKPEAGSGPKTTTAQTMSLLNDALSRNLEVWIGYADKGGMTTERVVEPLSISGGFLSAFDVRSNEVRTFTIARITGVELVDEKKVAGK